MICHRCNSAMEGSLERYPYRESGLENVFIERCIIHTCGKCKIRMAVLPDAETAAREIVRTLVLQKKRLDGQSILFIRKAMRLKSVELAEILRVHRVAVSRWENNQVAVEAINDFRLRLAVIDRVIARPPQKEEADVLKMLVCLIMQDDYDPTRTVGDEELTIASPSCEFSSLVGSSTFADI